MVGFGAERGTMAQGRSKVATLAYVLAVLLVVAVLAGPLAIHAGVASPFVGFRIFGVALVASLPVLLLSLAALFTSGRRGDREGRSVALRASLLSALLVLCFLALAIPARRVPPINDITTDTADPPAFHEAARAPENAGKDLAYPPDFLAQQQAAYPDVAPILVAKGPADAYAAAQKAAAALGWVVVRSDPAGLSFEATQTSRAFQFVDDVAVRVRPEGDGARVDVRSRSRVGKSDVGANAARIRAFAAELSHGG